MTVTTGKHRKAGRVRQVIRAMLATAGAGAVLTVAGMALGAPAHAQTVPNARADTCSTFNRWWNATEGGYRYAGYRWMVRDMVHYAEQADAPTWGDVWALAQVAPLADEWQSPEQQRAAMALIGDAAGRVALDCSIRL